MFKYSELKSFLEYAKSIAPIVPLRDWDHGKQIILRHDVDLDIHDAYKLSKVEKDMGIISTFFVLTTCHTYNPFSLRNRGLLCEMAKDGFEIGLHFDAAIYGDMNSIDLKEKVEFECQILESIINSKITSISLHNPFMNGKYPVFAGYNNAYMKSIFSEECYLSDSRMSFHGQNLYEFVKKAKDHPIQILFHPMHWSEEGDAYIEIFCEFLHKMSDYIDTYFRSNNSTYKKLISNNKLSDIIIRSKETQ